MEAEDKARFSEALSAMGIMFSDEMTRPRINVYWGLFAPQCNVDEWVYACTRAMHAETFHKVPLPAVLFGYIEEYRVERRQRREREWREARVLEEAAAIAHHDTNEWQAEQAAKRAALEQMRAEAEAELERKWGKDWRRAVEPVQPLRHPLRPEDLVYTPSVDAETAKARLREQLQQLHAEEEV